MRIFFDLDGTLIDSKPRLYNLFQYLVPASNLSFDEYWDLKRNKISNISILNECFPEIDSFLFQKQWMELIESEKYLDMDLPFLHVTEYLRRLKRENIQIYVATARQSINGVVYQFDKFGWINMFSDILVTEQKQEKTQLIKPYHKEGVVNWIVGDTGKDIQVGKSLGLKTAAVLSGFLNFDVLKTYYPDLIVENVIDFDPLK